MSDFLARLGARHIAEPTIRPRAASRFEPASAHMIDHDAADVQITPADERGETPPATSRGNEPVARPVLRSSGAAQPRASSAINPTDSLERDWLERDSVSASRDTVARVASVDRGMQREPESVRRADRLTAIPNIADANHSNDLTDIVPRASLPRETPVVATRVAGQSLPVSHSVRQADRVYTPATPDVVRVHIGRVEVRAVMSPDERARSRGAKASDAQGPLSLDRYLSTKGRP